MICVCFCSQLTPARLADLGCDTLTQLIREGREGKAGALLAAVCAFNLRHLKPPCLIGPIDLQVLFLFLRCANCRNSSIVFRLE